MMLALAALAHALAAIAVLPTSASGFVPTALLRAPSGLRASSRPADCSAEEWAMIVEAEKSSRARAFGGLLGGAADVLDGEAVKENQLKIWATLQERRAASAKKDASFKGMGARPGRRRDADRPAPPPPEAAAAPEPPKKKDGWFTNFWEEADQLAYVQASQVNSALEKAGVLEKVSQPSARSESEEEGDAPPAAADEASAASKSREKKLAKARKKRKK